ncbi:40s ribosomal protein s5-1 [Hordeum vulgare]|nr:40s ribosomal protein s5-1 [Hordeum vulgare]
MREGMLHIRDVEGPKKTGSVETRLEAMEQQVFKCQWMVERGLNGNHMMITEFTNKHMIDANDIGKHLSRLYDRIDQLQAQIYDLQNQNFVVVSKEVMLYTEEMILVFAVARTGDPPVVTPLVVPAGSTMMHASSMPIPDFSGSTTKTQEVLEAIHDAPPVYIAMVPVICSVECSTQVDTIDKIHDASTTVCLESLVDLNDKEVQHPSMSLQLHR